MKSSTGTMMWWCIYACACMVFAASPAFTKETAKLRLDNGLQAYLISDPTSHMAGASLTVLTGYYDDPRDHPGIAHLAEHVLLDGKTAEFVGDHGGNINAFTQESKTVFLFTINADAFQEALKLFGDSIKDPAITPQAIKREIASIDDEFHKSCEKQNVRELHVLQELALPSHPFHDFHLGNATSLAPITKKDVDLWIKDHYTPENMLLIVTAPLPIQELTSLVTEHFASLPKAIAQKRDTPTEKFPTEIHNHIIYVEPLKYTKRLNISWELPKTQNDTGPEKIAIYILGDEGPSSLLTALKAQGFATGLLCSASQKTSETIELTLEIDLTTSGAKNVSQVIGITFEAIASMKERKVPKRIFDELQTLCLINAQCQTRKDLYAQLMALSQRIGQEPFEQFSSESSAPQKFDQEPTSRFLNALSPDRALFVVIAPATITGVPTDKTEQWTKTKYALKIVPQDTLDHWNHAKGSLRIDLPDPNPYLPKKLTTTKRSTKDTRLPTPTIIRDDEMGKIFYAKDSQFEIPMVSVSFYIKTPAIDPRKIETQALADIYVEKIKESLNPMIHTAGLAGTKITLYPKENGIFVAIDGYASQAPEILDEVITRLMMVQVDDKSFKSLQHDLFKRYQDANKEPPLAKAYELFLGAIQPDLVTAKAKARVVNKLALARFQKFAKFLFKESYIEGIIYGSLSQEQAKTILDKTSATLHSKPIPQGRMWTKKTADLQNAPLFYESKNRGSRNAALLSIQTASLSPKSQAVQRILMLSLQEPFYRELRSQQHTGYVILTQPKEYDSRLFNIFAVESSSHDGRDLVARFELFLERFTETLDNGSFLRDSFDSHKKNLVAELKRVPQTPQEMGTHLHTLAFHHNGNFARDIDLAAALEALTYEEYLPLASQMIGKSNKQRLSIAITGNLAADSLKYRKITSLKIPL